MQGVGTVGAGALLLGGGTGGSAALGSPIRSTGQHALLSCRVFVSQGSSMLLGPDTNGVFKEVQ
eukprot:3918278-Pyramimonas_sp.AAC.1